jgi:hypothetical protein
VKKCLAFAVLLQTICGCAQNTGSPVRVKPHIFITKIPLKINDRGIMINTWWGTNKTPVELLWDNNSPTWVNEKVISNVKDITKSKKFLYSTTTADGSYIRGNIYTCDSIGIGGITFTNVSFYKIPDPLSGAIGNNIISNGVWEINFKNKEILFASCVDSLTDKQWAEAFASTFSREGIKIPVSFRNNITEEMDLDFGFNYDILLPNSDFDKITRGNNKAYKDSLGFSTPGSHHAVEVRHALDSIGIQKNYFFTNIATNKLARERLIGLPFFEHFDFVIFDYKNKLFYVSKERRQLN